MFRWTSTLPPRHIRRVLGLIVYCVAWLVGGPAMAATIQTIAIHNNRIVIRFDAPVDRAESRIVNGRAVIDVAADSVADPQPDGAVIGIQQTAHESGTRIAFDLASPAIINDGSFDPSGRTLTLDLRSVSATRFAQASAAAPLSFFPFDLGDWGKHPYRVSQRVPAPAKAPPLPRVEGDASRPLVVIDAGHGGMDPGAIGAGGLREKDVTLKIARAIRDRLVASGRVRVALTRDDDRFLVLRDRFGIARRLRANLFISIHCDSVGGPAEASGASVYTLSEVASDKEAARLAVRENKADVIAGVNLGGAGRDVSSILIDLTQRETMNDSADFARLLGREAQPLMPLRANFHRMASLMVLKAPDMPSILFETGYISTPRDAAFLASSDGRARIAESVERAVQVHFARRMAAR